MPLRLLFGFLGGVGRGGGGLGVAGGRDRGGGGLGVGGCGFVQKNAKNAATKCTGGGEARMGGGEKRGKHGGAAQAHCNMLPTDVVKHRGASTSCLCKRIGRRARVLYLY